MASPLRLPRVSMLTDEFAFGNKLPPHHQECSGQIEKDCGLVHNALTRLTPLEIVTYGGHLLV
jgi:hypothetical protein